MKEIEKLVKKLREDFPDVDFQVKGLDPASVGKSYIRASYKNVHKGFNPRFNWTGEVASEDRGSYQQFKNLIKIFINRVDESA